MRIEMFVIRPHANRQVRPAWRPHLTLSVTDMTDTCIAPCRDIRAGNEESAFRIVQDGSLRTAKKFNHKLRDRYALQIRVFDNGTPPLYSDSFGK